MATCLTSAGYPATFELDEGLLQWERPPGREADSEAAAEACERELVDSGRLEEGASSPDEQRLREWYDAYILINDCLAQHGYPNEATPSWDAFVDGAGMWHPWQPVVSTDAGKAFLASQPGGYVAAMEQLDEDCPQDFEAWLTQQP